ncbi:MAG TPA: YMGG-like glycine zipper-containing protein, partial [Blastocatellia bacterium]|nr:YMGG-like glycine zipper-containing protein [Blastocatellia bacterium]
DETQLIAILNENLSTTTTRPGDRFTMSVRSPSRFDGAVIEGYVGQSSRSGRLTGSPELALNFERIRFRNGTTEPFDGYIESVRAANGDDIRVDNEGVISERSGQTRTTVTRTGIGAALGALLGAIVSGGEGAAIGAALGAGAGAGSVFIRGRDDLHLTSGTEFSIRAIGPRFRAG